ncbi:MAG TPA: DUF2249 domain-containing protein [Casimicrobiaceae bacterium]|nr:DUF2249 domain-containing protein [Casimicrobiaceae bacterium]
MNATVATPASAATLDVRQVAPRERHPLIFRTFDALAPGEALVLVNDHDPKPLYYQFKAESNAEFTWEYLESGPDVWRVAIGKAGAAPAAVAVPRGCHCQDGL